MASSAETPEQVSQPKSHKLTVLMIAAVIVALAIVAAVIIATTADDKSTSPAATSTPSPTPTSDINSENGLAQWANECSGEGTVQLTHAPMNPEDIVTITPLGSLAGEHVTPIDHLYLYPALDSAPDAYPVFMMADGYIVNISQRSYSAERIEYRLVMQHTCTFFSYFDLILELDQDILDAFPEVLTAGNSDGYYFVAAGTEVGRIGGQSLDTAVYNAEIVLPGFINPDSYASEFWKIHTDDFFSYFPEDIREQLLAKNPRTAEPRSGKIDYDIPGTLSGNWFEEGSNGYAGNSDIAENFAEEGGRGYWTTHLAFVYDVFNPERLRASLGDFDGRARQFGIKGNLPDFEDVTAESGVVKYELVKRKNYGADDPIEMREDEDTSPVLGVVLVEVLADERIRFEVFPDMTASEVSGFTTAAKIYTR